MDSIVLLDRRTKRSRGFGFVTFADEVCDFSCLPLSYVFSLFQITHSITLTLSLSFLPEYFRCFSEHHSRKDWNGEYVWEKLRDQSK